MHIGKELREINLKALMKAESYEELDDLLRDVIGDSVSPAICATLHRDIGRVSPRRAVMSERENVRQIEQVFAAFGRGDIPSILAQLTDNEHWVSHLD
jgi:hypothetical protein